MRMRDSVGVVRAGRRRTGVQPVPVLARQYGTGPVSGLRERWRRLPGIIDFGDYGEGGVFKILRLIRSRG